MDELLLTVPEASRLLGISRAMTYQMVATGVFPRVRIGRAVRVPRRELLAWVADHTEGSLDREGLPGTGPDQVPAQAHQER